MINKNLFCNMLSVSNLICHQSSLLKLILTVNYLSIIRFEKKAQIRLKIPKKMTNLTHTNSHLFGCKKCSAQ